MYTYTYILMYTYTYTYIHTYMHTYIHTYIYIHSCIFNRDARARTHTHTHTHTPGEPTCHVPYHLTRPSANVYLYGFSAAPSCPPENLNHAQMFLQIGGTSTMVLISGTKVSQLMFISMALLPPLLNPQKFCLAFLKEINSFLI